MVISAGLLSSDQANALPCKAAPKLLTVSTKGPSSAPLARLTSPTRIRAAGAGSARHDIRTGNLIEPALQSIKSRVPDEQFTLQPLTPVAARFEIGALRVPVHVYVFGDVGFCISQDAEKNNSSFGNYVDWLSSRFRCPGCDMGHFVMILGRRIDL